MGSTTDRFGIEIPEWNAKWQEWARKFQEYADAMDSTVFSVLESANVAPIGLPNVEVYTDGSDKKFKMYGDAVFLSRTNNTRITISLDDDIVLIPGAIICASMTAGAVRAQETTFEQYSGGVPIDAGVQVFAAVDESYGLIWFNGARLPLDGGIYQMLAFQTVASTGTSVRVTAADTTPGFLEDKIVGDGLITANVLNSGGNEQLEVGLNGTLDNIPDGSSYVKMTNAERAKLTGIEEFADVTDAANVEAAGAVMDSTKGQPNGVAELDGSGKVPTAQLPDSIAGGLNYQGVWDADTNTPTLTSSVGTKGHYYRVSVAGSTDLDGITDWKVGDYPVFNGATWDKIDNTDQVTSVFGRQGAVEASDGDYSAGQVSVVDIDGSAYDDVQDWMNITQGRGLFGGGAVSISATTGAVDVEAGDIICKVTNDHGADTGFVHFDAETGIVLDDDNVNYVWVYYNSGTPVVDSGIDSSVLFRDDYVVLDIAYRMGADVKLVNYDYGMASFNTTISRMLMEKATGAGSSIADWAYGAALSSVGTRNLRLEPGVFYGGTARKLSSLIDTSGVDTFTAVYRDGAGGHTTVASQTQVDNAYWDDGTGTLNTLSPNRYGVYWAYLCFCGNEMSVVYGTGDYTLEEAQNSEPPSDLPLNLTNFSVRLGRIIIPEGEDTMTIQSAFGQGVTASGIPAHNGLSGLQGGDVGSDAFYHTDALGEQTIEKMKNIIDSTGEATGFEKVDDPANCTASVDTTARTVTLSGSAVSAIEAGVDIGVTNGWVSDPYPTSPTGTQFLYYNGGSFIWSTTAWPFRAVQIAAIVYNSAGTFMFGIEEMHKSGMDSDTHEELHLTLGTYRQSGGDISDIVLNSTTAANRRPIVSECIIADEDKKTVNAVHNTKTNYTYLYMTGTDQEDGLPNLVTDYAEIVPLNGGLPQYNEWTGSAWQLTDLPNNDYMAVFAHEIPVTKDTESQKSRVVWMVGQEIFNTLTGAQGYYPSSMHYGEFAELVPEVVATHRLIIRRTGGNWTIEDSLRLEGTRSNTIGVSGGAYLSTVTSDKTLTGNGTGALPLGVEPDISLVEGESYGYSDGVLGQESYDVGFSGITEVKSSGVLSGTGDLLLPSLSGDIIAGMSSSGAMTILDRETNTTIISGAIASTQLPIIIDDNGLIVVIDTTRCRIVSTLDLSYNDVSGTIGSGCWDVVRHGDVLYTVNQSDELKEINGSNYTVDSTTTLSSVVDRVWTFDADDTYLYGVDADTAAGDYYVRKWNLSTGALVASSPSFTLALNDIFVAKLRFVDGLLCLKYGDTAISMRFIDPSDMSTVKDFSSSINATYCCFHDGLLYGTSDTSGNVIIKTIQIPALAMSASRYTKLNDGHVVNRDGTITPLSDIKHARIDSLASIQNIMGVSVESVETTLPMLAGDNKLYLISGGTTAYEGMVLHDRPGGAVFYSPHDGAKIWVKSLNAHGTYAGGTWTMELDMVLKATTTDPTGVGVTTTLKVDGINEPVFQQSALIAARVEVSAGLLMDSDDWTYEAQAPFGFWAGDYILSAKDNSTDPPYDGGKNSQSTVNGNTTTITMTAIIKSTWMDDPTLDFDGTNPQEFELEVGHTDTGSDGFVVEWVARIRGIIRLARTDRYFT